MTYYFANRKFLMNKPQGKDRALFLVFDEQWKSKQPADPKAVIELQRLTYAFFEREWVYLKQINSVYEQQGPFSAKEIFGLLQNSSINSETLVWKKGFSQWQKISNVEVFCELFGKDSRSAVVQFEVNQSETADILESILEMQRVVDEKQNKNSSPNDDNAVLILE